MKITTELIDKLSPNASQNKEDSYEIRGAIINSKIFKENLSVAVLLALLDPLIAIKGAI